MTCPHCGKDSSEVTGKPFKNVMNRYVNKNNKKATFNEATNPFTDEKGVVWQIGSVWKDSIPTPPIKPSTPVPVVDAPKVAQTAPSAPIITPAAVSNAPSGSTVAPTASNNAASVIPGVEVVKTA